MDQVTQAVTIGSPLAALNKNFITIDELLRWLTTAPVTDRTLAAYRAACMANDPNEHYLEETTAPHIGKSRHFLSGVRAPEYGAIFLLSGGDIETPIFKDTPTEQLIQHIAPALAKLHTDSNFERKMKLICDKSGVPVRFIQENRPLLFQCHGTNLIREFLAKINQNIDSQINLIIESDYFAALSVCDASVEPLMARCRTLMTTASQYWEAVAKPEYREVFNKLIAAKKLVGSTKAQAQELNTLFPGIFGVSLERLSDLAYKITCLEFTIQAYVLGFPIQYGLPSPDMIEELLYYLSNVGKEHYAEELKAHEEKLANYYLSADITGWHRVPWRIRNVQDVLENNVYEYNSFDRMMLITGVNIHHFVRPEFQNLLKSHKNIWTNEDLPKQFEIEVLARLQISEGLKLPSAGTILELLTRTDDGTLYPAPEPASSNPSDQANNILQLLFGSNPSISGNATVFPGMTITTSSGGSSGLEQFISMLLNQQ